MTGLAPAGAQAQLTALVSGTTYLAACTADPSSALEVADLTELTTSGYSRVTMAWNSPTASIPSVMTNSNLVTFGPMSANMALAIQWVALITSSSGTSGSLLYTWTLDAPQQVSATQSINIAAGGLAISLS